MSQYLLPSPIFDEKPTVSLFWGFLICNKLFFSCSFHYFLFVFGFPWIVWMWISLCSFFFFWSSLSLLDVYVNVFLQVWGNFGHLFFQPLSITFWSSYLHICWYVCWCLTVLRSSVQSSSFFFLLLQLGSSVLIHLNSLILSFASSSLLLSPLYKFIHFHFCTFQL